MHNKIPLRTLKSHAKVIYKHALSSVDAYELMKKSLKLKGNILSINGQSEFNLDRFERIFVLGSGKASVPMASATENILKERISDGLIITKYGYHRRLKRLDVIEAGHPVPDGSSITAANKVVDLLRKSGRNDLIIYLLSGGTSALYCAPETGLSLEDKQEVTRLLLNSGANITEINIVRKHLSKVKGGKSGELAYPATVINLILSDTIGNNVSTTGSGPFAYDETTFSDVLEILKKYSIFEKVPDSVRNFITEGLMKGTGKTIKLKSGILRNCINHMIGDNTIALESAQSKAQELGYNAAVMTSVLEGEAKEVSKALMAIAKEVLIYNRPVQKPACLIFGGELTVTVTGKGKGGRCQEFALASTLEIANNKNIVVLSSGTDGTDGPTDAAGALVDNSTLKKNMESNAEHYLKNNNAYSYLKETGNLIFTGPTNSNVMDIILILIS